MADAEVEVEVQSTPPLTPVEDTPQPERKVIASTVQGTVKWFNVRNGYGFINRNDTKEDVFVHQTAIIKNNPRKFLRSVGDGEIVEFDVIEAPKGTEAANVTGPGGVPVKGSCYAPNKRRFRRRIFPRSPRPGKPVDGQAPTSEGEGAGENDGTVPAQRRRRPRRPRQECESAEPKSEVADDKQQRVPRRRFRPLRNRPFQPRPPSEQPDGQQPETRAKAQPEEASKQPEEASKQPEEASKQPEEASKQPEEASKQPETRAEAQPEEASKQPEEAVKQPDSPAPQQAGDSAEGQAQRPRRQFSRRRQRVSQSKNGTEKPASDSDTQQPQNSKPADPKSTSKSPKSSPKSSPKTSISQERSPPNTVCAPTE